MSRSICHRLITPSTKYFIPLFIMALLFLPANRASACYSDGAVGYYTGSPGDQAPVSDMNDWGLILRDAYNNDQACWGPARDKLVAKLSNVRAVAPVYWQLDFSGEYVMLVMAAGLALGGHNAMTPQLDSELYWVGEHYQFYTRGCGWYYPGANPPIWKFANTCMDDYSIASSGFAWKAAYYRLSGRAWQTARGQAMNYFHLAFRTYDSACIYNPHAALSPYFGLCNAGPADLGAPDVSTVSLNHLNQTPAYGMGLMTSIAAAFVGLEVAESNGAYEMTADEKREAEYLAREAQDRTVDGSDGLKDFTGAGQCYDFRYTTAPEHLGDDYYFQNSARVPCWDFSKFLYGYQHYRASMYPLQMFYSRYGIPMGNGASYQFNQFNENAFVLSRDEFFGAGRRETYKTLANDWFTGSRPTLAVRTEYRMALQTAPWYPFYYLNATGGGGYGSVVQATSTTSDWYESDFTLVDLNGGYLRDGDPVALRTVNGYYVGAQFGGGGAVTADVPWVQQWETFTIQKVYGSTGSLIADGDQFALRTYYTIQIEPAPSRSASTGCTNNR